MQKALYRAKRGYMISNKIIFKLICILRLINVHACQQQTVGDRLRKLSFVQKDTSKDDLRKITDEILAISKPKTGRQCFIEKFYAIDIDREKRFMKSIQIMQRDLTLRTIAKSLEQEKLIEAQIVEFLNAKNTHIVSVHSIAKSDTALVERRDDSLAILAADKLAAKIDREAQKRREWLSAHVSAE